MFLDGLSAPNLGSPPAGPAGVVAISTALEQDPSSLEELLLLSPEASVFQALNLALFQDGALIAVPERTRLERPIEIIHVNGLSETPLTSHPRQQILLGAGAAAVVVEQHVGFGEAPRFINHASRIELAAGARLTHVVLVAEGAETLHLGRTDVRVARDARYRQVTLFLGGAQSRRDLDIRLEARGAEAEAHAAYLLMGSEQADLVTDLHHSAPDSRSKAIIKGALADAQPAGRAGLHHGRRRRRAGRWTALGQDAAAVRPRDHPGEARAQDLPRRGAVRAWRHLGQAGRDRALLPAEPRPCRTSLGPASAGRAPSSPRSWKACRRTSRRRCWSAASDRRLEEICTVSAGTLTRSAATAGHNAAQAFDVEAVRRDFPVLQREVYGKPLVFLDSAASAQKPRQVMAAMTRMAETCYANVHRGVHRLSQESTDLFEQARERVAEFLNAGSADEIVFTRGATEAINLVAQSWGGANLAAGDEVIISTLEHHANIVPWQLLRQRPRHRAEGGADRRRRRFLFEEFEKLLIPRTKLVAMTHVSNALGTVMPVKEVVAPPTPRRRGAARRLPGGAAPEGRRAGAGRGLLRLHRPQGLRPDRHWRALRRKAELLAAMPPYQGGGEMIASVSFEEVTYKEPPHRFEAGTPPILEAIGLAAAHRLRRAPSGMRPSPPTRHDLLAYATERLGQVDRACA